VREELYRKRPRFEDTILLTEDDGALAGDGEGLFGFGVGADYRPGGVEGDGGYGGEDGSRLCLSRERESTNGEEYQYCSVAGGGCAIEHR